MTTDDYTYPDGVELLIRWLAPLGEVRTTRPVGGVLPWIMVRRIGGGEDGLTDRGLYSIQCFADTKLGAQQLGKAVDRRMCALVLGDPVIVGNGSHYVDHVIVDEHPEAVEYLPSRIYRVVGTYRVGLRITIDHVLECIIIQEGDGG